jgi:DNA-binding response OmpR family regulator
MHVDLQKPRFLIVDPDAHMRKLVRGMLHGFGARQAIEAADGITGLELVETRRPDFVLVERVLPDLTGVEFTRMIRNGDGASALLPIVMIAALTNRGQVVEARDAGVTEFLVKPLSAQKLGDRIASVLRHPRPFVRSRSYVGPDRRRFVHPEYVGPERRKAEQAFV